MNTSTKKRLISLALAICLVIGAMMIPGLGSRVFAADVTAVAESASAFDVSDMKTLEHPYIYADQARFDELSDLYFSRGIGDVDKVLYSYLVSVVETGYQNLASYEKEKDTLGQIPAKYLQDTDAKYRGYDEGGRLAEAGTHANRLMNMAFAYQITRDDELAEAAYDYAVALGKWEHWGPGHFLNAADAMGPYAVAYDWLYSAWDELGKDVEAIELVLFTHGLVPAFYSFGGQESLSVLGDVLPWRSYDADNSAINGWVFHTRTNNWNAVCSSGVTLAALALAFNTTATSGVKIDTVVDGSYEPDEAFTDYPKYNTSLHDGLENYQDYAEYIVNQATYYLPTYGLGQYVPDGSYIESNGYWSYGTNSLFRMAAALTSVTGSDFGLLDAQGINKTAYFAANTMSSDGLGFNYHDSNTVSAQDTSLFMYLGSADGMGDKTLAGMRKAFLDTEISKPSIYDCLYYLSDEEIGEWSYPALENWWEGIDGYVVRDSWDPSVGTLYAGFLGEANNVTHGQIDSGSFIYYNKGVRWFCDLGTENYNAKGFWDTYRGNYYVMGAEGNNTVILTSQQTALPFGQAKNGSGELIEHGNNENGSYAIIDNTSVYGGYATSAKRGLLLTDNRKTTVIQDEITFGSAQSVAWIAHTLPEVDVILSVDGTVAYLHSAGEVVRVTLIDKDNAGLKFRLADASERLLVATFTQEEATELGGNDYSGYKKLLVEAEGVTKFNIAVVIEEVVVGETLKGINYEWKSLTDEWANTYGGNVSTEGEQISKTPVANATLPMDAVDAGDTPIIDFGNGSSSGASSIGETVTVAVYSFDELERLINKSIGSTVKVTLLADCDRELYISNGCVINKNNFELDAESPNLVMHVDGETVEFKTGSIDVIYVVNGVEEVVTVTSSANAQYTKGLGTDIEYSEEMGTYVSTCAVLYSDEACTKLADTTISNINNKFYVKFELTEFDGAFVTVKDGEVVGHYYDPKDLFTDTILNGGNEIHITSDFEFTSNSIVAITKAVNIYFHGHTITHYAATRTDEHLMSISNTIASGTEINFVGPGGFDNRTSQGRVLFANGPANVTFTNMDFTSISAIIDQRTGNVTFDNCRITINANTSAVSVINRNNAMTGDNIPYMIINNCRIYMPKLTSKGGALSIQSNGKLEVTGGTQVTVADGYLFRLVNRTVGTVEDYEYDTTNMRAIIGEVYHNCKGLAIGESAAVVDDPSTEADENEADCTKMVTNAIYYGVGAQFTLDYNDNKSKYNIISGCSVVRQNNTKYPLVVVNSSDVVWIKWLDPDENLIVNAAEGLTARGEAWSKNATPTKAAIVNEDGTMWVFPAGQTQAAKMDIFGLKINMSMQSDFSLNFYVEAIEGLDENSFAIKGGVLGTDYRVSGATYEIDDKMYYRIAKIGINPQHAAEAVTLQVTVDGTTIEKSVSPIDYAELVLSEGSTSAEAKAMMINVVKYIMSAYAYTGEDENSIKEYVAISALYEEYKSYATASVVDRSTVDIPESIKAAIAGAQLNLEQSANFRFILTAGYTGTVTLSYKALDGSTVDAEYQIDDGKNNGVDYIEIPFKAYYMTDDITITVGGDSVVYKLANYYHYNATEVGELTNLLNALFAYCETAANYKASVAD